MGLDALEGCWRKDGKKIQWACWTLVIRDAGWDQDLCFGSQDECCLRRGHVQEKPLEHLNLQVKTTLKLNVVKRQQGHATQI
jgi:hypothetical protein